MVCCLRGMTKDNIQNAWEQLKREVGAYIQVKRFFFTYMYVCAYSLVNIQNGSDDNLQYDAINGHTKWWHIFICGKSRSDQKRLVFCFLENNQIKFIPNTLI